MHDSLRQNPKNNTSNNGANANARSNKVAASALRARSSIQAYINCKKR